MVDGAPQFADIAEVFYEFLGDSVFVAHNASFDLGFIQKAFLSVGIWYDPDSLCTVQTSRQLLKGMPSYSLGNLCANLGIELNNRHRAYGDASATVRLLKLLNEKAGGELSPYYRWGGSSFELPGRIQREQLRDLLGKPGWLALVNRDGKILTGLIGADLYQIWKGFCKKYRQKSRKWNAVFDLRSEAQPSRILAEYHWMEVCRDETPLWQKKIPEDIPAEFEEGWIEERWGSLRVFHRISENRIVQSGVFEEGFAENLTDLPYLENPIKLGKKAAQMRERGRIKYL